MCEDQRTGRPEWHRYCLCRRLSFTSHRHEVPSKLDVNSHRSDFENRVANMGPFSTGKEKGENVKTDCYREINDYLML